MIHQEYLLLTNDGEFANLLMHPRNEIEKEYIAKIKGIPLRENLKALKRESFLKMEKQLRHEQKSFPLIRRKERQLLQLTIHEGRNRQVRRMFEAIGNPCCKTSQRKIWLFRLTWLTSGRCKGINGT